MRILITGLALSRNLGAPAMALSLIEEITKKYPNVIFTMAVSSVDMEQELVWFEYYKKLGFNIDRLVPRSTITSYILNKFYLKKIYQYLTGKHKLISYQNQETRTFWLEQHEKYLKSIQESDRVISMFGISYIGDGVHKWIDGLNDYSSFYYAEKYNTPYVRFIQSFGPFNDFKIRFFAKKELNKLPFVYARGKNSASYCKRIVNEKNKVYDMPDLAILLKKADDNWTKVYLSKLALRKKDYIVVSPSAVIYAMPKSVGGSIGSEHVKSMYLLIKELVKNYDILMLPHMYSDKKWACDREICYKIFNKLNEKEQKKVSIVKDDIDAMQAKSLIASSKLSIVSRYHALVAAVSTSTPVITIGWNIKYYDLMEYYRIENMAIDTRDNSPKQIVKKVMDNIALYNKNDLSLYVKMKIETELKVQNAVIHLLKWIKNEV